ncbi:MAG: flagellar biosynthesis protein FliQ [Lachnospiraceae bacterium]|nr:flagellar biosynthesis protein FliQ [Lachnospiraceae bacterium]
MTEATVIDIAREVVWVIVKTSAPMLIVSLVVGLIISIFQTITSIQEQTLTFAPKFLAIMLVLVLCGGWMLNNMTDLFVELMENIPQYIKIR